MGSWGAGLWDNDSALDYIDNLVERIITDLETDLATVSDGVLERMAGPCVSLLATLVEQYRCTSAITMERVAIWRGKASSWLAEVIASESSDQEAWIAYKQSFDAEFERLATAIQRPG